MRVYLCVCSRENLGLLCWLSASCLILVRLWVAALHEKLTAEPQNSCFVWVVCPKLLVFWFVVLIYEPLCGLCALDSLRLVKLGNGLWALGRYVLS